VGDVPHDQGVVKMDCSGAEDFGILKIGRMNLLDPKR
jgi:hypothetical protein